MMSGGLITFVLAGLIIVLSNNQSGLAQSHSRLFSLPKTRHFKFFRYVAPEEPSNTPYERTHCVDIDNGMRVCKHISQSETFFAIEKNGSMVGKFETTTYNGGASRFEVLRGDLDGDGKAELIIANRDGVSNGIGFDYW